MDDIPILVVGAGPSGLTLALQLRRYGVACDVIDRRKPGPAPSKALSINPATLQIFDDLDVITPFLVKGTPTFAVNLIYRGRRMSRLRFERLSCRFPYFLMLPQPDTEAALADRFASAGGMVEWGTELAGLELQGNRVNVSLRRCGRVEQREYQYVVGCDGARSTVRDRLGIEFKGHDYEMYFLLADASVEWTGNLEQAHYFIEDGGFSILLPLPNGLHRVVVKSDEPMVPGYEPSLSEIQSLLTRYGTDDLKIRSPIWLSSAPFYNRIATNFQVGHVFLAGDAAHLFSPIGGLGMNTGVGDAFNLGWKLGYVLNGRSGPDLLESYEAERRAHARRLLITTDRSTSLIARLGRHTAEDEGCYEPRMRNREFLRVAPWAASGLSFCYSGSDAPPTAENLAVGRRVPYVAHAEGPGGFLGRGAHRVVIAASAGSVSERALLPTVQRMAAFESEYLGISVLSPVKPADIPQKWWIPDSGSSICNAMGLQDGRFLLVRPDYYVQWMGEMEDGAVAAFLGYLERLFVIPRGRAEISA